MAVTLEEGEDMMKYLPTSLPSLYVRSDPLSRNRVNCSLLLQLTDKPAWVILAPRHAMGNHATGPGQAAGSFIYVSGYQVWILCPAVDNGYIQVTLKTL